MKQNVAWQIPQWKTKMFEKLMEIGNEVEKTYVCKQVTDDFPPSIDIEIYGQTLKEVISLLKEYMPEELKTLEELETIDPALLLQATLEDGSFDLDQFSNPSYATTVLIYTTRPFLKKFAKQFSKNKDLHEGKMGHCPVCGHNPVFASLSEKENGRRHLICPLCETKWSFNRVACPFCLEKDPEKLGYFRVEDDKQFNGYKVNFCQTCKGYIKTCDERSGNTLKDNILLEDAKTSHLDYLAQKEGFKR